MGDRCYFSMRVLKKDKETVSKIMFGDEWLQYPSGPWCEEDDNGDVTHYVAHLFGQCCIVYLQHTTDKWNYQQYPNGGNAISPIHMHDLSPIENKNHMCLPPSTHNTWPVI